LQHVSGSIAGREGGDGLACSGEVAPRQPTRSPPKRSKPMTHLEPLDEFLPSVASKRSQASSHRVRRGTIHGGMPSTSPASSGSTPNSG
jgi:hypothetical protein